MATHRKSSETLSDERLRAALLDLFGLTLGGSGLMNPLHRAQDRVRPGREAAVSTLRGPTVAALDETGIRFAGDNTDGRILPSMDAVVHTAAPTRGA